MKTEFHIAHRFLARADAVKEVLPVRACRVRPAALDFLPLALARTRETKPQVGRTRADRLRNVRGAFRATSAVSGRDILLVDDVITTGATADACGQALILAGARSVHVIALARSD